MKNNSRTVNAGKQSWFFSSAWRVFSGKLRQLFLRAVPTLPNPDSCPVQVLRELNWRSHQSLQTSSIWYNYSCFIPNVLLARNTKYVILFKIWQHWSSYEFTSMTLLCIYLWRTSSLTQQLPSVPWVESIGLRTWIHSFEKCTKGI